MIYYIHTVYFKFAIKLAFKLNFSPQIGTTSIFTVILSSKLLYPSGKQEVMFCDIKSLILNGSGSNFEHFSLKTSHIFLPSSKTLSSTTKKFVYLSIIKNWVVINMLKREKRLQFYI